MYLTDAVADELIDKAVPWIANSDAYRSDLRTIVIAAFIAGLSAADGEWSIDDAITLAQGRPCT